MKPLGMACAVLVAAMSIAAGPFRLTFDRERGGIASLRRAGDARAIEFIAPGRTLGDMRIRYRRGEGTWQTWEPGPSLSRREDGLISSGRFALRGDSLLWTIRLRNEGNAPIEVGDLALPLPMYTLYPKIPDARVKEEIFTRRLIRHAFIAGHGSFLFWLPVCGKGPHLVMLPRGGTRLEYFTETRSNYAHGGADYIAFIHSAASAEIEPRGTWRQAHTRAVIPPGREVSYGFSFHWTDDYDGVRDILAENGGLDIRVAPGMVVPEDLDARIAFRTRNRIEGLVAEFPDATRITSLGRKGEETYLFRIAFARPGENRITVRYGEGRAMPLEFFVTQPLETLIKKRARFIAGKQQHRDPSKWYDGLFSLWDVRLPPGRNLLGPENLGGQHPYAVSGSDDPSNSKCIYLSEKNVAYPEPAEIEALEYFIRRFVWGKHQRTDREHPYPYGIYGCDSWHQNRFAKRDPLEKKTSRPGGPSQCRMWRTFDYTTYFALYYNMYRIAKRHPDLVRYLDAAGYLERAYGTARAYFEVPYDIRMEGGWSFTGWTDWAYTIGNFHEKYLLGIAEALAREGLAEKAAYLRGAWEKKVKYFIYDDPFPFISEMPVDSTAYESTYAIAKYALTHHLAPDEKLWRNKNTGLWYSHPRIDRRRHEDFLARQLAANLACRGWLEASYFLLGSDFRGCGSSRYTLSYMSQMGGWAILDHALVFSDDPARYLRLGYASMLSSWALLNAGPPERNYGFWFPGERHDGAAGWGFFPQKFGRDWNPGTRGIPRGAWPVDGEIDHGLTAYVETAATIVFDDPLFGLVAYGGTLRETERGLDVVPRDGVRRRLDVLRGPERIRLSLARDGFARDAPISLDDVGGEIRFTLENRSSRAHTTRVDLLEGGRTISVSIDVPGDARTVPVKIRARGGSR